MSSAIEIRRLRFAYPGADAPVFGDLSLAIPAASRCLLLGANGVGKSTLLRLVAGHHLIGREAITVLGRSAFHDTSLAGDVAFMGGSFPFSADISVAEILASRQGVDPGRRARVLEVLEIDPAWRMHRVSDGQRRRVQILLDLERTLSVILLDEVTADLDVLSRADLLSFLRTESEERGATIVYATHVLDGIDRWATHVAFLSPGRLRFFGTAFELPAIEGSHETDLAPGAPSLRRLCETWMRADRKQRA